MSRRASGLLVAIALQALALVLAHELVFLARYGSRYGEALVHAGHGESWTAGVTTVLLVGACLGAIATIRLARLGLLVRRRAAESPQSSEAPAGPLEWRLLLRAWVRLAPRISVLSVVLLTIQENLERGGMGQPLPGPGLLLSAEYPIGLWITVAVGLAVSLVAALFEWRRHVLLARLRDPLPRPVRAAAPPPRTGLTVLPPVSSLLGRRSALRAPPPVAAV